MVVLYGEYSGACGMGVGCFFFFKQKTAYEMLRSLVGSEMCIRDRLCLDGLNDHNHLSTFKFRPAFNFCNFFSLFYYFCLLYTSDAADE